MVKQALIEAVICYFSIFGGLGVLIVIGMLLFMWDDIKTIRRK